MGIDRERERVLLELISEDGTNGHHDTFCIIAPLYLLWGSQGIGLVLQMHLSHTRAGWDKTRVGPAGSLSLYLLRKLFPDFFQYLVRCFFIFFQKGARRIIADPQFDFLRFFFGGHVEI